MGDYFRYTGAVACNYFVPSSCTGDCVNVLLAFERRLDFDTCNVYSGNQTVAAIESAVNNYLNINSSAVANFMHPSASCGANEYPYLSVVYNVQPAGAETQFPVSSVEMRTFLNSLYVKGTLRTITLIQLHLPLVHVRSSMGIDATYLWKIIVDFTVLGQVRECYS
jgi:hypothetical protein